MDESVIGSNELPTISISEIEFHANDLDLAAAAKAYDRYGCLVVRGLLSKYIERIAEDVRRVSDRAVSLLDRAEKIPDGWTTPDGTLFIPAPEGLERDKQLMVIALNYKSSSEFFRSALDVELLDLVEAILGPDVELFGKGQSLVKEPVGGHAKHMHQDSGYFEHRFDGPVAILTYVVETNFDNGALHVVPGSHRLGQLHHVDTSSHLGLDDDEWPIDRGLRIDGKPGDSIFFNVKTIHGSPSNHSDAPRPVFIHRYRRADDFTVIRATNEANRTGAEQNAVVEKARDQFGYMVRGFRTEQFDDR